MAKYEIKLINKTVNFRKRRIRKTYKITKVISKCGVVPIVTIAFVIVVVVLGLRFGRLKPSEPINQSELQIVIVKLSDSDLGKGSNPWAIALSDARKAINNKSKPGRSGYAEAWSANPLKRSWSAAANRLA